ncbi:sensor domain-containing diguanylate cyclase [Thermoanaerobacter pentosaceus]|uniref:Diguanylate cyclase (GGDEF)-like protein n=1 Tax=Thermoanaerobacter pentosaceus TaxID=694059 RepID=A0ABT9M469_9THEO|nr:sensor domain-containing diguanylate cyclase [Thermoanaerobacter pentosaceus]MDP9750860.1 diguanylate cyclase (GGDEF)-like protein [Thermoanaerobacter pentosaceus]
MGKYKELIFNITLITVGSILFVWALYYCESGIDWRVFLILLVFAIILDNLGILYTDIKLSLSPTIGMITFLIFGTVGAAALMIASVMFDTIVIRKKVKNGFLNGGMLSITYLLAGWFYEFIGGKIGIISLSQVKYILSYVIVSFLLNNFILYYALKVQGKILFKEYWNESVLLELGTYIVMIPVSLVLAYIYFKYELLLFVLSLTPLIFIAYAFRMIRDLIKANKRLNAIYEMVKMINSKLELEKILDTIMEVISQVVSISAAAIYLTDSNGVAALVKSIGNREGEGGFKKNYFKDEGIIGKCISSNKTIAIKDLKQDKRFLKEQFLHNYGSVVVSPLRSSGSAIGCLAVLHVDTNVFDEDSVRIIEIIVDQASVAIINAKRYYEVTKKSITDPLTKTYNRRYFNDALMENIMRADENSEPVSLIMFDLDNFKLINDTYGHLIGDEVLKEVAKRIKNNVRSDDIVARFGGEEFAVILPKLTAEQAYTIAERIRSEVSSKPVKTEKGDIHITITGGVADYPRKADSAEKLISHADRALYAGGKSKGRNKIAIYEV